MPRVSDNNSTIIKEITNTSITVSVTEAFSSVMGELLYYAIIVYPGTGLIERPTWGYWNCSDKEQWPHDEHQCSSDRWVGDTYIIIDLQPNTTYRVKVRGFTSAAYRDTGILEVHTGVNLVMYDVPVAMIVGILVAVIVVTFIIAFLYQTKGRLSYFKNW